MLAASSLAKAPVSGHTTAAKKGSQVLTKASQDPYGDGFISNRGQWDNRAFFFSHTQGGNLWVTKNGLVYDFREIQSATGSFNSPLAKTRGTDKTNSDEVTQPARVMGHVVAMDFVGANPETMPQGISEKSGHTTFINSRSQSIPVKSFQAVTLPNLYDGVDLKLTKDQGNPRFDLVVAPGKDASAVKIQYRGADSVRDNGDGTISIGTSLGDRRIAGLKAYQALGAKDQPVACSFKLIGNKTVAFRVGKHNPQLPLVIDPVIYSTLMGAPNGIDFNTGNNVDTESFGVAVGPDSEPVITGYTQFPSYPTTVGAYNKTITETTTNASVFVSKFTADGTQLVYSTIINSGGTSMALDVQQDASGRAVIAGFTSGGYPTTSNAYQSNVPNGDNYSDFMTILSADGTTLDFSTLFGGGFTSGKIGPLFDFLDSGSTAKLYYIILGLQIDGSGNIYLSGKGTITPTADALESTSSGDGTYVACFNNGGIQQWSTYFSYVGTFVTAMTVGSDGGVYLCGQTSGGVPTTNGAFDTNPQGFDGFVSKINPVASLTKPMTLSYSTLLGGNDTDACTRITVDQVGDAYVFGFTGSVDFPLTPGCYYNNSGGGGWFLTKVAGDGAGLLYSTLAFAGWVGVNGNVITDLAVDKLGDAYICGSVNTYAGSGINLSTDADQAKYAAYNPTQPLKIAGLPPYTVGNAFMMAYTPSGTGLLYGTYWGGTYDQEGEGMATDNGANLYMVGWTDSIQCPQPASVEFPTTSPVFDNVYFLPGLGPNAKPPILVGPDAFLTKFRAVTASFMTDFFTTTPVIAGSTTPSMVLPNNQIVGTGVLDISTWSYTGVPIVVTSSNPSVVRSPGTITIPASSPPFTAANPPVTRAYFYISTSDVTVQTDVTLTAVHDGISHSVSVTVVPYLQGFSAAVASVVGGNTTTARVVLSQPATTPVTITLNTSNPNAAEPVDVNGKPATTVTIPANGTFVLVPIKTVGVDTVTNVQMSAQITGPTMLGYVSTTNLQVLPASVASVRLNPQTLFGGGASSAEVVMNGAAGPTPITVHLALTQGTAPVTVSPTTVTISSQANTANFTAQTQLVTSNSFRTIQATEVRDGSSASASIFVLPISVGSITLNDPTVVGGSNTTGFVTLNAPAPSGGFTVSVVSSSPGFASPSSTKVAFAPGSITSNTFTVSTAVTTTKEVVTIYAGGGGASKNTTITLLPETLSLSMNPTSIEGGSRNVTGTLTLGKAETNGTLNVKLSSNNSALKIMTSQLSFAPPNTTAHFTATTTVVNSVQNATVTATLVAKQGLITATAVVQVKPIPLVLDVVPSSLVGGVQNGAGSVTLGVPPQGSATTVTLSSSNQTAASVPGSVSVPVGSNAAKFTVTSHLVNSSTNVTITGTVAGGSNTFVVTVLPPQVTLKSLTVADASDFGPFSTTATLTTTGTVPQPGVNVTLTSSNPGAVQVPNSVLLPAGATSVQFSVTANAVQADTPVTIKASFGSSSVTASMDILAQRSGTLTVTPAEITGGGTTTLVLQLNAPAPAGGLPVTVTMSGPTGFPSITVGGQTLANGGSVTLTIPGGKYAADFTISTQAVSRQLGATLTGQFGAGGNQSSGTLILNPQT